LSSPSPIQQLASSLSNDGQQLPGQGPGSPLDARGVDWRGQTLGPRDLTGARLCRADLRGSDLHACKLDGADVRLARYDRHTLWPEEFDFRRSGAVGPQAKLDGAFLNSADLACIDLRGASLMGAYLSGTDLSGGCLHSVRIAGADLRHAFLRGALCEEVRFFSCQLDFVDFRHADLTNSDFTTADSIRGADFSGASLLPETRTSLLSRNFHELDCWNPLTRRTTRESLNS